MAALLSSRTPPLIYRLLLSSPLSFSLSLSSPLSLSLSYYLYESGTLFHADLVRVSYSWFLISRVHRADISLRARGYRAHFHTRADPFIYPSGVDKVGHVELFHPALSLIADLSIRAFSKLPSPSTPSLRRRTVIFLSVKKSPINIMQTNDRLFPLLDSNYSVLSYIGSRAIYRGSFDSDLSSLSRD